MPSLVNISETGFLRGSGELDDLTAQSSLVEGLIKRNG